MTDATIALTNRTARRFEWRGLRGWVLPIALVLACDLLARQGGELGFVLVRADQLATAFLEIALNGELARNLLASLGRVAIGVGVGGALGLALAAALALVRPLDRALSPLLQAARQVPTLGWIPLLGLWFGYGEAPKQLLVIEAAFFPILLNAYEGLRGVDHKHLEAARVLRFTAWQTLTRVRAPAAAPMLATGLQQALAFSWIACVGVEILFGSGPGVGAMIEQGHIEGRMEFVFLGVLLVGLLAFFINDGLGRMLARVLNRGEIAKIGALR